MRQTVHSISYSSCAPEIVVEDLWPLSVALLTESPFPVVVAIGQSVRRHSGRHFQGEAVDAKIVAPFRSVEELLIGTDVDLYFGLEAYLCKSG